MSIFKRKDRKSYYCKVDGKFRRLHPDRKVALEMWHSICADREPAAIPKVSTLLKSYYKWLQANRAKSTCVRRLGVLKKFSHEYRGLKASLIRPHHVTRWADARWKNSTTRHDNMGIIQAAFSWARKQGHIRQNPLAGMEKPRRNVREDFVPVKDWCKLLEACTPPFDALVRFTLLTGARPQESVRIEAKHVRESRIVFSIESSKGKRRNRVIHLNDDAQQLVSELCEQHSTGPIFRNSEGKPWKKDSVNCRMRRLKEKLGWPWLCLTALRHSFAHAHVEAGTDSLLLQQLMGHQDGRMLSRVYAHADRATDALVAAAAATSHLLPPVQSDPGQPA